MATKSKAKAKTVEPKNENPELEAYRCYASLKKYCEQFLKKEKDVKIKEILNELILECEDAMKRSSYKLSVDQEKAIVDKMKEATKAIAKENPNWKRSILYDVRSLPIGVAFMIRHPRQDPKYIDEE